MARRTTDLFWLLLFLCALGAQVFFAAFAVLQPLEIEELQGESFDEVLQNVTERGGWLDSMKDTVAGWVELRPKDLRLESKGITAALCSAACSSCGFLLLLAYFPVHLVVNCVALGVPGATVALGCLAQLQAPPAVLLGIEAQWGWPLVILGILGLMLTSFAWQYLRLGVAVLKCSAAFLRARPWIGAYPFLFGLVHLCGLALWGLAVLGIRSSFQEQWHEMDWHSQFGSASAMLLCFLWGNAFVTGLSTFAVAYAASHWYGRGPEDGPGSGVLPRSVQVALRYHAGSIALGSLLLAFVRTLKVMLWWAEKAQEEAAGAVQGAVQGAVGMQRTRRPPSLLRSLRNFAAEVLEAVATWASKQAFVQVAMSGCAFASGAMRAAHLASRAPAGFLMVEALSNVFQRACEFVLVVLAVIVGASLGLEGFQGLGPVAVSAYLAAEFLLHPYSVATTTILHCCLLDMDSKQQEGKVPKEAMELQKTMHEWGNDASFVQHYR